MSFDRPPDSYERFMGVYAEPLAEAFLDVLGVEPGQRALDVGCGTGVLTSRLVDRLGPRSVAAIDPSAPFVEATRARLPDCEVRRGVAEDLPWADDSYDLSAAQLVVHFMRDPVAGLGEMLRVTRPGGQVGACVWDHAGAGTPLATFWRAVHAVDPEARDESGLAGSWDGHLAELLDGAGGEVLSSGALPVSVRWETFDLWWHPYTLGIGPVGDYVQHADPDLLEAVVAGCRAQLGPGPFTIRASAWYAVAAA